MIEEVRERGLLDNAEDDSWERLTANVMAQTRREAVKEQIDFLQETSTWSLAFCGRQCGKGWIVLRMMIETAMKIPGSVVMYVRKTRQLAIETMWSEPRDGILATLPKLGLVKGDHYNINLSSLEVWFKNGSVIRFDGIDRALGWADVRGKKYALIVLDEMQEQNDEGLQQALDADIPACFVAYGGRFVGIGTPGQVSIGRFHDICEDIERDGRRHGTGWKVHRWRSWHLREKTTAWQGLLDWKTQHNIPDTNPRWRRDGLGEWCADDSQLMLPVEGSGLWDGQYPEKIRSSDPLIFVPRRQQLINYAGLDFGFVDPCAIVIGSISREEGVLREVYSDKREGMSWQQMLEWIKDAMKRFSVRSIWADYADARSISMLQAEGVPVLPCDKSEYDAKLSQMKGAIIEDRLKVLDHGPLREELMMLSPDPRRLLAGEFRPRPGQPDHCFDAFRYLFNGVYLSHIRSPEPPLSPQKAREREIIEIQRRLATPAPFDPRSNRRR